MGNQQVNSASLVCECLSNFYRRGLYPTRDCTACTGSQFYLDNSTPPLCICKDTFYDDGTANSCLPCTDPCSTCVFYDTQCLSCVPRFYLSGNSCLPCHYSCETCSGPLISNCLVCSISDNRKINPGGQCLCDTGFIDVGVSVCGLCHYSCLSCSAANSISACSSCHPAS